MKILFISDPYPSKHYPNNGVFVYAFVQQLVKDGHDVTVISPKKITFRTLFGKGKNYGSELATVYRPSIITASAQKIGFFNTYSITHIQKRKTISTIVKKNKVSFDVVYCHFISSALYAIEALYHYSKPIFVAVGENKNIEVVKNWYKEKKYFDLIDRVAGFIAVSTIIQRKLINTLGIKKEKILIACNGTNLSIFYPQPKIELRRKYKFPLESCIVIFIGRFIHSKGPLRLVKALEGVKDVKMIFVGEGSQMPVHSNVIFRQKVCREEIPKLLNCADIFVLPTLHEGSNNAIVEAMACGLPIISSDIPEIREQCNSDFSILVNPLDIDKISNAIHHLMNHPEQVTSMGINARKHAAKFDITSRSKNVVKFIEDNI